MIKIYGRDTCNNCNALKKIFQENKIEYAYYDIDKHYEAMADYMYFLGSKKDESLPLIIIENKQYSMPEVLKKMGLTPNGCPYDSCKI